MSSVSPTTQPVEATVAQPAIVPRLQNGDRLTRAEFERRYRAMPHVNKAQLIEGIVYMPSPVRLTQHGEPHIFLAGWLFHYLTKTPGLRSGDNSTSRLDEDNEPQPDLLLLLPKHLGGTGWVEDDGYVCGTPDWVAEIAASSVSIDLHAKLNAYRRNGVREYLVVRTDDRAVDWFELTDGQFVPKKTDEQGRLRSVLFPGLWLNPAALLAGDLPKLVAALDEGIATDEHRAFVEKLAKPAGE